MYRPRLKHFSMQQVLKGAKLLTRLDLAKPRILLVEDDPTLRAALEALLKEDFAVEVTATGPEALATFEHALPQLILSDIMMPGMTGIELLGHVRSNPSTATLPVILLSAVEESDTIVKALELGANDFINKPINPPILNARIHAQLRAAAMQSRLETQNAMLAKLAAFDELTGVYNRRSMQDALESEVTRSTRYERPLSVLLLDLDHFKKVNDVYGHAVGDKVLQAFVERASTALRTCDILCRYGGEEFCVIMPDTAQDNASSAAERIRLIIEQDPFELDQATLQLTASIGLSCLKKGFDGPPESLLIDADKALYRAKEEGRNRVCIYSTEDCQVAD